MRKSVVKLNLHRKSVPVKIGFGRNIVTEMTANIATFATPSPALAAITTATDNLEIAYTASLDGGRSATAEKNAREEAFDTLVTALANYVDGVAKGDETIILSAGMEAKRAPRPIGVPAQVLDLSANIGILSGEIALRWKKVYGAAIYLVYQKREIADPFNLIGESTKTKFINSGLASAQRYYYKVVAVGAAGVGPDSDIASSLAY
ncbi:MAG: hypothetical protein ABI855_07780 [Bacteroidota bacterium]